MKRELLVVSQGFWGNGGFNLNYSRILTTLIKEAAQNTKYSSDIELHWNNIRMKLKDPEYKGESMFFGFRENGVDNRKNLDINGPENYRAIYELLINVCNENEEGELCKTITMELYIIKPSNTILRPRLEEIATKFKDALFEACGSEAWDYINDTDMDLTSEEMEWLGIEPLKEDWDYE